MRDSLSSSGRNVKNDLLSGLTVALALVPEATAFAFVAGVSPVIGLYSAFFMGFITAAFGGRPGMISGATGAMAVVVVSLVAGHGIEYMFPAVMLCGLIQIGVGLARLGMFIRMVPHPVMLGFVNGLAIVIFMAQFGSFKTVSDAGELTYLRGPALGIMLALTAVTMSIIWLLPKLTKAVPASLVVTGVSLALNEQLDPSLAAENQRRVILTVGDMLLTNERATAAAKANGASSADGHGAASTPAASDASSEMDRLARARAAMSAVSPDSVGLSAGLPRPFFWDFRLPPVTWGTL